MWIAGLAVIAAIAASIQLSRPPELVWWTSPPLGNTGQHVRVLIPYGWKSRMLPIRRDFTNGVASYRILPVENRPALIRWLFPRPTEDAVVGIDAMLIATPTQETSLVYETEREVFLGDPTARRSVQSRNVQAVVNYFRTDKYTFDRTYAAICNSLRIE